MNRIMNVILILLITATFIFAQAGSFTFPITITDGNVTADRIIGFDPTATDFVDAGLDSIAPPPPPAGNFDARFISIIADDTTFFREYRDDQLTEKRFNLEYAASSGNGPIVLSWDASLAATRFSSLYIKDDITGNLFGPYDMLTNNSLDVSTAGGIIDDKLRIYATPAAAPDLNAEFEADVTLGPVPLTVNFDDQSTQGAAPINFWQWTFGDGSGIRYPADQTYTDPTTHTYAVPGRFSVQLTVKDGTNTSTETKTNYITVTAPPQAAFTANVTSGDAPLTVNFTDQSAPQGVANITNWSWNFGDGSTSTSQNPTHTYATPGEYTVTLTVTDNFGDSDTESKTDYIRVAITTPNSREFSFNVSDGSNNQSLIIGNNADGTDGFDFGLDQLAPPAPPSGNFDARLTVGLEELYVDIRDNNVFSTKTFVVEYASQTGQGPIVLSWNPATIDEAIRLEIVDNVDGTQIPPIDMRSQSSLNVSAYGGLLDDGLRIIQKPNKSIVAEVIGPEIPSVQIQTTCSFIVTVRFDFRNEPNTARKLGSFTGSLTFNTVRLDIVQVSSLLNDYIGNVVVDEAAGRIDFNGAKVSGQRGIIELFDIEFYAVNGNPSTLNLEFSAIASSQTFENLLPLTDVRDLDVDPENNSILLGDVNADGLVNSTDALIVLSYNAWGNLSNHPVFQDRVDAGVGDVNQDGETNSTDALIILSYDVGLTVFAPVAEKFCF